MDEIATAPLSVAFTTKLTSVLDPKFLHRWHPSGHRSLRRTSSTYPPICLRRCFLRAASGHAPSA
ncbi:MAG: hypothetical protein AAF628_15840, partial [Planctomycetota bacterium]